MLLSLSWDPTFPSLGVPGDGSCDATSPGVGLAMAGSDSPVASPGSQTVTSPAVASRQSTRLCRSRTLPDGQVPTIPEKAAMRAVACDLTPGTSVPTPSPAFSGSRFVVLDSVPLAHLVDVASDCDIVF